MKRLQLNITLLLLNLLAFSITLKYHKPYNTKHAKIYIQNTLASKCHTTDCNLYITVETITMNSINSLSTAHATIATVTGALIGTVCIPALPVDTSAGITFIYICKKKVVNKLFLSFFSLASLYFIFVWLFI